MATVGRRVSARGDRGAGRGAGRGGLVGAALAVLAVVGLVAGLVLTRGGAHGSGAAAGQAVGTSKDGTRTEVQPAGADGLLTPTLQCPGRKVRTASLRGSDSSKDTPTDIARRWLGGKGEGQPEGVRPTTFRVIVAGGAGSTTAKQGYLMLLDTDEITVALLEIDRARSGGGWTARSAATCG